MNHFAVIGSTKCHGYLQTIQTTHHIVTSLTIGKFSSVLTLRKVIILDELILFNITICLATICIEGSVTPKSKAKTRDYQILSPNICSNLGNHLYIHVDFKSLNPKPLGKDQSMYIHLVHSQYKI